MTSCEELADGGLSGLPEARASCGPRKGPLLAKPEAGRSRPSESAARRRKDAAVERREAPASSQEDAATEDLVRRLALHSLAFCEGKREGLRRPRALKNRGDDARPLTSWLFEI
jgi:hypothetical protein